MNKRKFDWALFWGWFLGIPLMIIGVATALYHTINFLVDILGADALQVIIILWCTILWGLVAYSFARAGKLYE